MENFEKEITFLSKQAIPGEGNDLIWRLIPVTKTAVFKELDQTNRDQHKLHFMIISLAELFKEKDADEDDNKMTISSDKLYDLTTKSIKTLLIVDETSFSASDKVEFLNDSAAILNFALWMLKEKFMPFFSQFKMN